MIKEKTLEDLKPEVFLKDNFYLNTQKPVPLSQKITNKLLKYSKPFGLGIGTYLGFELIKKLGTKTAEMMSSIYSWAMNAFNSSIDSVNIFLLNFYEVIHPRYYFHSVTQIISILAYITGVGFMIKSLKKFKDHNDTKGEIPISQAILLAVVAALLLMLPTLLKMEQGVVISPSYYHNPNKLL